MKTPGTAIDKFKNMKKYALYYEDMRNVGTLRKIKDVEILNTLFSLLNNTGGNVTLLPVSVFATKHEYARAIKILGLPTDQDIIKVSNGGTVIAVIVCEKEVDLETDMSLMQMSVRNGTSVSAFDYDIPRDVLDVDALWQKYIENCKWRKTDKYGRVLNTWYSIDNKVVCINLEEDKYGELMDTLKIEDRSSRTIISHTGGIPWLEINLQLKKRGIGKNVLPYILASSVFMTPYKSRGKV